MRQISIRLPDIGEGIATAELVEWTVAVGDLVSEDQVIAAVMTDKATVEIPCTFGGTVVSLGCEVGETLAVGAELIRLSTNAGGSEQDLEATPTKAAKPSTPAEAAPVAKAAATPEPEKRAPAQPDSFAAEERKAGPRQATGATTKKVNSYGAVLASPSVRRRALDLGVDLAAIEASGSVGQITHADIDAFLERPAPLHGLQKNTSVNDIKVVGMRRKIAERMSLANTHIPHITYVEEVDITALEQLRKTLNARADAGQPKLTILPFIVKAIALAVQDEPTVNAHYDDEAGTVRQFGGVHAGIAIQTPAGLVVGCVPHVEALDVFETAAEIQTVSAAAKAGVATRQQLSGSTITVSSVGPMGGLASTPIINRPEVAIVGVTKVQVRPMWDGSKFVPRTMVNLASSFDHRIVDGWNAATFIHAMKAVLEEPALLFIGKDK